MFIIKDGVISSTFSSDKMGFWDHDTSSVEERLLRVVSLDFLFSDGSLPSVSFLKADVEGYERDLLLGARETIRTYRPKLSICTYHLPDDWREIPSVIRSFGMGYKMRFSGLFDHVYGW